MLTCTAPPACLMGKRGEQGGRGCVEERGGL